MNTTFVLLIVLISITVTFSRFFEIPQYSTTRFCYQGGGFHPAGQEWSGRGCRRFRCRAGTSNTVYLQEETCAGEYDSLYQLRGRCQLKFNFTKTFPGCCIPEVKCPDYSGKKKSSNG